MNDDYDELIRLLEHVVSLDEESAGVTRLELRAYDKHTGEDVGKKSPIFDLDALAFPAERTVAGIRSVLAARSLLKAIKGDLTSD